MNHTRSSLLAILAVSALLSGCNKPYDVPEYVEVKPNETAIVIPLEGDITKQVKFDSVESIEAAIRQHVNVRRIQIPHRWDQRGKGQQDGAWIPLVQVVKVNRTPVTMEFEAPETGARVDAKTANAIWLESRDSIGFSTGFTVTAFIEENQTALFVYNYPASSLADVIKNEMKARLSTAAIGYAAQYDMAALRERKIELAAALEKDLKDFYSKRGITITTVGLIGGFTYDNPKVQESIDAVFQAQQEVQRETAIANAQVQRNLAIQSKAQAEAEAIRSKGNADADAVKARYLAEAEGVAAVNKALAEAGNNPLVVELRRVEKWDGRYPQWFMGGASNGTAPSVLLNVPTPAPAP